MKRAIIRRPSPAIVIAILALVAGLAGSAVAEQATTAAKKLNKPQKKQVKKIAKKRDKKQDSKNFPVDSSQIATGAVTTDKVASSVPAARVTTSTVPPPVPDLTGAILSFDAERYDSANLHSSASPTRLTAPVAGVYLVGASVFWKSAAGGVRTIRIRRNGSTFLADESEAGVSSSVGQSSSTAAVLAAGEYVELVVNQSSGSPLEIFKSSERSPEFSMTWLAPGP